MRHLGGDGSANQQTHGVRGSGYNMAGAAEQRAHYGRQGGRIQAHGRGKTGDHGIGHTLGNVEKGHARAGEQVPRKMTKLVGPQVEKREKALHQSLGGRSVSGS